MALHRAQLLLDSEQHIQLRRLARESGRSMSEVVREIVDEHLAQASGAEEARQGLAAIDALGRFRRTMEQRHGRLEHSLLDELREERDVELISGECRTAPSWGGAEPGAAPAVAEAEP